MSVEIIKAKTQIGEIPALLKQGKLFAAATNLQEAVAFILKTRLLKHEVQTFADLLEKAVFALSMDSELRKIYPLKITYRPGEEESLLISAQTLRECLQEELDKEAAEQLAALEEFRGKQLDVAREFLQDDETTKARHICDDLVATETVDTGLNLTVADLFLEFGKHEDALGYLQAAYVHDPDSVHVFNKLGMALRKSGRLAEAEKIYLQALKHQPGDEYIYFNLGRVYLDMGHWKNVIAAANSALAINADFSEARHMKNFAAKQRG